MRALLTLEVSPDELGTTYLVEVWDADRETPTRPLYTLTWRTTETSKVDFESILQHARHVAYVAYSRIGAEIAESDRHRPIGQGLVGPG